MKNHLNTHCSDPIYRCQEEGCGFSCRSSYGLRRHYDKVCEFMCDVSPPRDYWSWTFHHE